MNWDIICYVLGRLVLAEAVILGIPFLMALYGWERSAPAFAVSICICVLVGLALRVNGRSGGHHGPRLAARDLPRHAAVSFERLFGLPRRHL